MPSFGAFALALSLLPSYVVAQEPAAPEGAEFRAGQWGVQFGAGFNLVNIGIMKFSSPRSAWLLLFEMSGEFLSGTRTNNALGVTSDVKDRSLFFTTGVGRRFYQAPRHKVRSFQSIGIFGSYGEQKQSYTGSTFPSFATKRWAAGALGELGAGYWVTPNLSLGGTANLTAGYSHRLLESTNEKIDENGWFVSGVNVLLVIGLYF